MSPDLVFECIGFAGILPPAIALMNCTAEVTIQHRCFARQRGSDDTEHLLAKKSFADALSGAPNLQKASRCFTAKF